jgi:Uma2 family endonuclease
MSIAILTDIPEIDDLETSHAADSLFEMIDGQRVEIPPMSAYAVIVASRLAEELIIHNHQQSPKPGRVFQELLFRLPIGQGKERSRRPDLAFVSFDRVPVDRLPSSRDNAWAVVPDLAIEVISPNDLAEDQLEKVLEYFRAGVRLVWMVYPRLGYVHVFHSPSSVHALAGKDLLSGAPVLPGFSMSVSLLFDDPVPPPA